MYPQNSADAGYWNDLNHLSPKSTVAVLCIKTTCPNVDECNTGTHDCDINAACTDTDCGFICQCNSGYSGNGTSCNNIDECTAETHDCDANADCTDNTGGFSCQCNNGYRGNGTSCTPDSQTVNVPFGGGTVAALVEVTGLWKPNNSSIAKMFDKDDSTFWHGTKLTNELRSSVKLTFTVSYIDPG